LHAVHSQRKMHCVVPVNILDENIIASQHVQLRKWRIRFNHIGTEIGRQGMKDLTDIVPLLPGLRWPTFFTHDLGFFDPLLCHKGYSLVCLDVKAKEAAVYTVSCAIQDFAHIDNALGRLFWCVKGT
jgi:hypothetical protein